MSQAVVIKSNKYGIHLVLSNEISFKALLDAIVEKFKESEKFFKGAKLAISFEGRKLTHDEEMAIIDAVTSNTSIEILCIVDHDPDREAYVKQQIEEYQASVQQPYVDGGTQFYRGTLRSGQTLESETGIVVVGDVNPGAAVMANGSIVVLRIVGGLRLDKLHYSRQPLLAILHIRPPGKRENGSKEGNPHSNADEPEFFAENSLQMITVQGIPPPDTPRDTPDICRRSPAWSHPDASARRYHSAAAQAGGDR